MRARMLSKNRSAVRVDFHITGLIIDYYYNYRSDS